MKKEFIPEKYRGIRPQGPDTNGNLHSIWVEQENGTFTCNTKTFSITRAELESDVRNGFLIKIIDNA